jgi:hypothetical protein
MRWTWQQFHDAGGNGLRKLARADLVEEVRGELLSPLRVKADMPSMSVLTQFALQSTEPKVTPKSARDVDSWAADDRLPSDHLPPSRGGAAPC